MLLDQEKTETEVMQMARRLLYRRPFGVYPRRTQQDAWKNRPLSSYIRETIWSFYHDRNHTVPLTVPWHRGLRIRLNVGNELSRSVFVEGIYEPNEFAWLASLLLPGMVVVDIGAHEGIYTLFAALCVGDRGHVWSIEPSSREREYLVQNVRRNRLRNVTLLKAAAGENNGQGELQLADDVRSGRNTITGNLPLHLQGMRSETVAIRTLDHLAAEHHWTRLDLLKIDTEGAEAGILKGAADVIHRFRPAILFEAPWRMQANSEGCRAQIIDMIRSHDYDVFGFDSETGLPTSAPGADDLNLIAISKVQR